MDSSSFALIGLNYVFFVRLACASIEQNDWIKLLIILQKQNHGSTPVSGDYKP